MRGTGNLLPLFLPRLTTYAGHDKLASSLLAPTYHLRGASFLYSYLSCPDSSPTRGITNLPPLSLPRLTTYAGHKKLASQLLAPSHTCHRARHHTLNKIYPTYHKTSGHYYDQRFIPISHLFARIYLSLTRLYLSLPSSLHPYEIFLVSHNNPYALLQT